MKQAICDGTGDPIPDDTPTTGPWGRQYSDAARVIAEQYLQKVNDLHTRYSTLFQQELEDLRAATREHLKQLPDDPA